MMKQKKLGVHSIRVKLTGWFIMMVILLVTAASIQLYVTTKQQLTKDVKVDMERMLEGGILVFEALNNQIESGQITVEQAQETARDLLNGRKISETNRDISQVSFKLGEEGYMFALDSNQKMMMHPVLEGQNMQGMKDKSGKVNLIEDLTSQKQGVVHVDYLWNNEETEPLRTKIAISKYYEPWDWYLCVSEYTDMIDTQVRQWTESMIFMLLLIGMLGIIVSVLLGLRLSKPIIHSAQIMQYFAEGDLTHTSEVKGKDETAQLAMNINTASEKLSDMLKKITKMTMDIAEYVAVLNKNTEESTKAVEQVAQTIDNVAQGASEQAAAAQKGAHMVNMSDGEVSKISRYATSMQADAEQLSITKNQGAHSVQVLRDKSDESSKAAIKVANGIERLNIKSDEIGKIVTFISSIAQQTNLLALNAAIEAARAGEQGRGFAVVAEEIRQLAEESQKSAKDIASLVKEIQDQVHENTTIMQGVGVVIEAQLTAVEDTDGAFKDIAIASEAIVGKIQEITASIHQVERSSKEIVDVINDISAVSEESAAAAQEVAATTEEQTASIQEISGSIGVLDQMIENLEEIAGQFKLK